MISESDRSRDTLREAAAISTQTNRATIANRRAVDPMYEYFISTDDLRKGIEYPFTMWILDPQNRGEQTYNCIDNVETFHIV